MSPHVPELPAGCDVLTAALLYAVAGWYVLPVSAESKHAGSVLGKGWQLQSSRDPQVITAWFAGTGHALALHVGRSGAVAFDVDVPELMPAVLRTAIDERNPPYQSSRANVPGRGSYIFAAAPGSVGNSSGDLGKGWGEVRGLNGIIVVEPSAHEKHAEGGQYRWVRRGVAPALTDALAAAVRPPSASAGVVNDPAVRAFLANLPGGEMCPAVAAACEALPSTGRHDFMVERTLRLARLGDQGHRGVAAMLGALREVFVPAVAPDRKGGTPQAEHEYDSALAGAVAEVLANPTPDADKGCCTHELPDVTLDADEFAPDRLKTPGGDGGVGGGDDPFALLRPRLAALHETVRDEAVRRAVAHEAGEVVKAWVREREAAGLPAPALTALGDLLDEPDEGPSWRIAGLWPAGGRVVLSAQFKTGKTTLTGNLVRCLADGSPFLDASDPLLGSFEVTPLAEGERVAVIDLELSRRQLREWLRDQGIDNRDRVHVETLRGRLGEFDLGSPERRAAWAGLLRDLGVRVLIIDPLAPLLTASGTEENDNAGVARVLGALDDLCESAGVAELLVTHHMGHNGERSRGASRLRDWPDAEWKLVRESTDDGEPVHGAPRYFSALGRDVEISETQLHFDQRTRRLGILGGNRTEQKQTRARAEVLRAVREAPGATGRQLETAGEITGVSRQLIRETLGKLVKNGELHTWSGPRNAIHYLAGCNCPSARDCVNAELAASGEKVGNEDQQQP